jgi:hypothetical protein
MADAALMRAIARVRLACKALSAAASDLTVARERGEPAVDAVADELNAEIERVCELAHELERRSENLGTLTAGARV